MKTNRIVITITVIVLSALFLAGCKNYEKDYINKAQEILKENELDGEVSMKYDERLDDYKVYDLIVKSDGFESKSDQQKEAVLKKLDNISFAFSDAKIIAQPTILSQGNEYKYYDEVWKNSEPLNKHPKADTQAVTVNGTLIGSWNNTHDSLCPNLVISKNGSSYELRKTCNDGSGEIKTLTVKVVGDVERLYENPGNAYGDYMVIQTNKNLAFYDDQGLIYELPLK